MTAISSRATNGNETKIVASTMPGHGEDDLDVALEQPRPEPPLPAEELHEDQSGHDR